jgi:probable HAF family extracellular repeat protein
MNLHIRVITGAPGGLATLSAVGGQTLVGLGHPPGGTASYANAISADGRVVVGSATGAGGADVVFRWSAETGMVPLQMPQAGGTPPHDGVGVTRLRPRGYFGASGGG